MTRRDFLTGSVGLTALGAAGELPALLPAAPDPDCPVKLFRGGWRIGWMDQKPGDEIVAVCKDDPTDRWTWTVARGPVRIGVEPHTRYIVDIANGIGGVRWRGGCSSWRACRVVCDGSQPGVAGRGVAALLCPSDEKGSS